MQTISPQDIDQRLTQFEQVCRLEGIKVTHQRLEIFREVIQAGDHPDADTVYQRVRERLSRISLDTVYRTLWLLSDLGLITTRGHPYERTRFDGNLSRHHHFVCVSCGLTRDFFSNELDSLNLPDTLSALGRIETTQVEARGICRDCLTSKEHHQTSSPRRISKKQEA